MVMSQRPDSPGPNRRARSAATETVIRPSHVRRRRRRTGEGRHTLRPRRNSPGGVIDALARNLAARLHLKTMVNSGIVLQIAAHTADDSVTAYITWEKSDSDRADPCPS